MRSIVTSDIDAPQEEVAALSVDPARGTERMHDNESGEPERPGRKGARLVL
jgi:hypothetical protein